MKRTICNPVGIAYAYQKSYRGRESADPAVILYENEYYLFASHGDGYWISENLADWSYVPVDVERFPQFRLFAPAVCAVGKTMYLTHSEGGTILRSDTPKDPESWVDLGKPFDWNDPAFWYEDGYVYVYEGCSDRTPLRAAKLDPAHDMRLVEGPIPIAASDVAVRGFERRGDDNEENAPPFFEGPWMNKIGGKYYLTYAAPGTQFSTYADGCFTAESPMGPFRYCENSPVIWKNSGFLRGCGHGCLFADRRGRLWKMDTVTISVNHMFERRLGLYPAKIGADGNLYVNTEYGDRPVWLPEEAEDPFGAPGPDWYVLSENAAARASSALPGHGPEEAVREDARTWWSAETGSGGEWLELDLGRNVPASALQLCLADQDAGAYSGRKHGFGYRLRVELSADGEDRRVLREIRVSEPEDESYFYLPLEAETPLRRVRVTNLGVIPAGGRFAVSGVRVFGRETGNRPAAPENCRVEREKDARGMLVRWDPVKDAKHYLVRFGTDGRELHSHFLTPGDRTECRIGCLNAGVSYYVTVAAINDSGTSENGSVRIV